MKPTTECDLAGFPTWPPEPLDEAQMRSVIGLLDDYPAAAQQTRLALDRLCDQGALSARQRGAVLMLFLLPAADVDQLLGMAYKDDRALDVFLRLRARRRRGAI